MSVHMNTQNKAIAQAIILIAAFFCSASLTCAEPFRYTPVQEYAFGKVIWDKSNLPYYNDEGINRIFDSIINDNRNVLRLKSGENDTQRGLEYPRVIPDKDDVNANNLPGGITTINKGLIDECFYNHIAGRRIPTDDTAFIYGRSQMANVLAHEMTHWVDRDWFRLLSTVEEGARQKEVVHRAFQDYINRGDWKLLMDNFTAFSNQPQIMSVLQNFSVRTEMEADAGAFRLLERSEIYSPGSFAVYMETRMAHPNAISNPNKINKHPPAVDRYNAILARIAETSGGRVKYENRTLYLDGKKFLGTGAMPDTIDGTSTERTLYLAGQLAKAVKYRMGTKDGSLYFAKGTRDRDGRVALMGRNNVTGQTVMFDLFRISPETADALMNGKKPVGEEEKALVAIHDFLKQK